MLKETVDSLKAENGGLFVDGTMGGGGHSYEILSRSGDVRLIGIDQDKEAIAAAKKIDRNLYTEESYKALQDALSNARKVLKNENATQEEVDQAVQMLNDAMAALKPVVSLWKWLLIGGIALVVIGGATTAIVLIRRKKKKNNET